MAETHLPYCVWRHLTSCVSVLSREVWGWCVGGVRCVTVCAHRCFVSVDIPDNRTLLRFTVLKRPRRPRLPQRDAVLWLATLHSGLRRLGAAPMVQHCDRSELKGTHLGVFQQRYLVHQLVLARSPLPPPRPQISPSCHKPTGVLSGQSLVARWVSSQFLTQGKVCVCVLVKSRSNKLFWPTPPREATHCQARTHVWFGLACACLSGPRTAACLKPATCSHSGAIAKKFGWHAKGKGAG